MKWCGGRVCEGETLRWRRLPRGNGWLFRLWLRAGLDKGAGKCEGGTAIVAGRWRRFLKMPRSTQSFERMNDRRKRFGHGGKKIGPCAKVLAHDRSPARSLDTVNRVPDS